VARLDKGKNRFKTDRTWLVTRRGELREKREGGIKKVGKMNQKIDCSEEKGTGRDDVEENAKGTDNRGGSARGKKRRVSYEPSKKKRGRPPRNAKR